MKDQLIGYINLLFAGNPEAEEMKQEILLNTLDRYDDLVASGKTPEAAYSLSVAGIGDVSELLGAEPGTVIVPHLEKPLTREEIRKIGNMKKRMIYASAALMLTSLILALFKGILIADLIFTLVLALAAALLLAGLPEKKQKKHSRVKPALSSYQKKLRETVHKMVWLAAFGICLGLGFCTGGWIITLLLIPIAFTINAIVDNSLNLKEAGKHEA